MTTIEQMRAAADTLEFVARLYGYHNPSRVELSADWLRQEADRLNTPIPGVR